MTQQPLEVPQFLHNFAQQQPDSLLSPGGVAIADKLDVPPEPPPKELNQAAGRWRALLNRLGAIVSRGPDAPVIEISDEHIPIAETVNDAFYEEQARRWENAPYTPEDLATYFTPEHLSSLTMDQYVLLMRRFPGELVTHVTRQGIRDHMGMIYHTEGVGSYSNGFANMLEDRRLRSPLGVYMIEEHKEAAVGQFLNLGRHGSAQEALERLDRITHPTIQYEAGSYADRSAIHFAAEEVGNEYYGSERGNEIFIAFPAAMIASQYHFNGDPTDNTGGYWNDLWVWEHEQAGIPLDAGLIFIPANAQVDRNTGSRYQLDEQGSPLPNVEGRASVEAVLASPELPAFYEEAQEAVYRAGDDETALREALAPLRSRLQAQCNITNPRLLDSLVKPENLLSLKVQQDEVTSGHSLPEMRDAIISGVLTDAEMHYMAAQDPISSQEYWEGYFNDIGWRPSKVVFYEDSDPTAAMRRWRDENDIWRRTGKPSYGFPQHAVERGDPVASRGMERFRSLALNAIDNHFGGHQA
ncbi:MAG TPA: hypothetical protein VLI54_00725 [Bacillota bacterium]|nr:hypothetical protein [Bacillota bacterium]